MKIFLLDLWHDLQEKRLWPVAAVLLAGLVAVPVLLAKPAAEPAAPAPVATDATPRTDALKQLAKVKLGEENVEESSTLGVFDPSNPFKPPKGAIRKQRDQASTSSGSGPSSGSPSEPSNGGSAGGSDPGGSTPGGSTPGGSAPGGTVPDVTPPHDGGGTITTAYKYVVDVTFSANGRTRRIKGLEKLDMLPNQAAPLLIFMGVTAKGGNAVFLVDSSLEAAGEGRCKPSGSECAFAYIGAGSEHVFSEQDGDTYTLRIDEIRKVKLGSGQGAVADGAQARASVGPARRFVPPVMADLIVVASERLRDSSTATDGR